VGGATQPEAALTIRNRLDELGPASMWLQGFADSIGLPDEMRYRLDTGLNEAVTNVISYAYPDAGEHLIRLRLRVHDDAVSLEVEDDGLPFDPLRAASRPAPHTLEEAPIGGLGIQLIRSMLDECHYRREAGLNHLTMIARPRDPASPDAA
jgi:anti-sigma regulatory factor (Ser/Thr protein kinase)